MARKFLVAIDLNKNELQNARIQNLATAPSSPVAGQIYYNTTSNSLFFWTGSAWQDVVQQAEVAYGTFAARPAAGTAGRLYYATDQQLLYFDNGSTWAQVSNFGSVTAQTSYGASSGNGTSTNYARADHTHGTPALTSNTPSTQAIGDAASVGTGTAPARDDHKHAMPSFGSVTAETTFGQASANGTSVNIARADHTHGTPTHDNAAHSAINLSALAAPTADVSFGNYKITSLATPVSANDAATKQYVDDVAQGLHIHASVVAATTANLTATYSNGSSGVGATLTNSGAQAALTLDGVTLSVSDRVLVKNQTTQLQNGIYTVTTVGSGSVNWVLTRATDFDQSVEVDGGDFVFVTGGTQYDNTGWVQTSTNVTVGTTAIVFDQFSGAGTYLAGDGLLLTGNTFSFNPSSTGGLENNAAQARVKLPTNSGLVRDANGLAVGAGTGITVSGTTVALTSSSVTVNGTSISLGGSGTITANTTNALTLGTGLTGTSFNGSTAVTAAIDTSVVVRKYSVDVGDGSSTAITLTHNLGTRDVQVTVYTNSGAYEEVVCDVEHTTTNTVILRFSTAPTSAQYRAVVFA